VDNGTGRPVSQPEPRWQDRQEIAALEAAYGPRWDTGDGAGWSGLYVSDGVFEVAHVEGRPDVRLEGHDELAARCVSFNQHNRGIHLLQPPDISIADGSARSLVPFSFWGMNRSSGRTWDLIGIYEVHYQLTDAGWRIRRRLEIAVTRRTYEVNAGAFDVLTSLRTAGPTPAA
jgi:hypothetical protein